MDAESARDRMEAELRFMRDLGGRDWAQTYVQPFYLKMQSASLEQVEEVAALLPKLKRLALAIQRDGSAAGIGDI